MCIPDVSPGYTGEFAGLHEDYRVNVNVTKSQKVKNHKYRKKKNSRNKAMKFAWGFGYGGSVAHILRLDVSDFI